ncbi:MAG: hypothetical protein Q9162_007431 [Coniocarpon cinnabarinum]
MATSSAPFGIDSDLQRRVDEAAGSWPDASSKTLLRDISQHVSQLNAQIADLTHRLQQLSTTDDSLEPPTKKRKTPQPFANNDSASNSITAPLLASIKNISFSLPLRKKCRLEIYGKKGDRNGGVKVVDQSTGETEAEMMVSSIEQAIVTPLPDRPNITYNYCILPVTPNPLSPTPFSIVFTVSSPVPSSEVLNVTDSAISSNIAQYQNFAPLLNDLFNVPLSVQGKSVLEPNPNEFVSSIVQAHRKNEKSWCTKAWVGSKEGWLYPLGRGLLFGFKKPVIWIPLERVESVSYTNVLQRTFNMAVRVVVGTKEDEKDEEMEFCMIDQGDFANVDEWVKKRSLNDASLSRERRAVVYGVNKTKAEKAEGNAHDGDGRQGRDDEGDETELAKAERELQDREDEEEEDFDPGSEGESDGSGSSSGEEDGGGDDDGEIEEEMEEQDEEEVDDGMDGASM